MIQIFQFLPYDPSSEELRPFNVRIEELSVIDTQFLHGCAVPTLVTIYQVRLAVVGISFFKSALWRSQSDISVKMSLYQ